VIWIAGEIKADARFDFTILFFLIEFLFQTHINSLMITKEISNNIRPVNFDEFI